MERFYLALTEKLFAMSEENCLLQITEFSCTGIRKTFRMHDILHTCRFLYSAKPWRMSQVESFSFRW